ncbi:MAG: signal peptidase I [Planctomycetota bacterium]
MAARGDRRVEAVLLEVLRRGPRNVLEIRRALKRRVPRLFRRPEGRLHPFLHGLLARGTIHVLPAAAEGLARYGHGPAPSGAAAPRRAAGAPKPEAEHIARTMASAVRDPTSRARVAADVAAHLGLLRREGDPRAFGSPRSLRTLMRRVDRRRPTVLFPDGFADLVRKLVLHEGPWLLGAIVVFLLVRTFVAEVFYIPSASMVPTLLEGDRVVVFKPGGRERPTRWAILTFDRDGTTYVKRAVGLGGERILLQGGDVYLDGELAVKPDPLRQALRFPYRSWDLSRPADAAAWAVAPGGLGEALRRYAGPALWSGRPDGGRDAARWALSHRDVRLRDVYFTLEGVRAPGGTLEVELGYGRPEETEPGGHWVLRLSLTDRGLGLRIRRRTAAGRDAGETWLVRPAGVAVGGVPTGSLTLELSFVDGVVRAVAPGTAPFVRRLGADVPPRGAVVTPGFRVAGAGTRAERLVLEKDLHYSEAGEIAVVPLTSDEAPGTYAHPVPPGHVFFLGDNTHNSRDSRFQKMGDVPQEALIGPVVFRILPPMRTGPGEWGGGPEAKPGGGRGVQVHPGSAT